MFDRVLYTPLVSFVKIDWLLRFTDDCVNQSVSTKNLKQKISFNLAIIWLFKVNNSNFKKGCKICSKLTIKTPERCQWRRHSAFIFNFEHISDFFSIVSMFLLLTLSMYLFARFCSHLLKKSLIESFIFLCSGYVFTYIHCTRNKIFH